MSDEKLKGCPIPGCGGAAVASPNKENARVVECSAQGCLTWLPVGLWQALPRPSEAVLEVARELRELERDHSDRLRRGEIVWPWTAIGPLLSRLESAAPVLPAPTREIVAELREQLEQGKRPRMATAWRAVATLESAAPGMGTPGSVWIEQRDLLAVARVSAVPIEVNGTFLIRRHRVHGTPQPKADAGECCICSGIADTFACTECMDLATRANPAHLRSLERDADVLSTIRHRLGGIDNEAVLIRVHPTDNAIAPQRPKADAGSVWVGLTVRMKGDVPVIRDVAVGTTEKEAVANSGDAPIKVYGPLPVIGALSKGECAKPTCPGCDGHFPDRLEAALAGEAKARGERDALYMERENAYQGYCERVAGAAGDALAPVEVARLQDELSTLREQLAAAQRMVDEDSARLVEAKRERDALREQLGEAENAKDTMSEYITRIVGGKDALAERVRELEDFLKRTKVKSADGKLTLWDCIDFNAPTPPTTAEGDECRTCFFWLTMAGTCAHKDANSTDPDDCCAHYSLNDKGETMPVCPKCGKRYPSHVEGTYYCDCDHDALMSTDEWLRYCAENTKCVKCGELPRRHEGCGGLRCNCHCIDDAEWLDNNKEHLEDKAWHGQNTTALNARAPAARVSALQPSGCLPMMGDLPSSKKSACRKSPSWPKGSSVATSNADHWCKQSCNLQPTTSRISLSGMQETPDTDNNKERDDGMALDGNCNVDSGDGLDNEKGKVSTPRAEALRRAREGYTRGNPGGIREAVSHILDYLEAHERDS